MRAPESEALEGGRAHRAAYLRLVTIGLALMLPVLVVLVESGGSVTLFLLALIGILAPLVQRDVAVRALTREERLLCFALLAFIATVLIALATARFDAAAIRMLDVLIARPLFAIVLIFLLIRAAPPEGVLWFGLAGGALATGANAVYEVLIAHESWRASGATNPILYGNIALAMGFMCAAGKSYFRELGPGYLAIPIIAFASGLGASLLSGTRGAWVAIPVMFLLLLLGSSSRRRGATVLGIALAITLATVAALVAADVDLKERVYRATAEFALYYEAPAAHGGTSVGVRLEMWQAAWDMFREQPLLGGGLGDSYRTFLQEGAAGGKYHPHVAAFSQAHNEILMTLATRGLLGLAGLLALWLIPAAIFVAAVRHQARPLRRLGLAGLLLLGGYFTFGLTEAVMHRGASLTFFVFYATMIVCQIAREHQRDALPLSHEDPLPKGLACPP